MADYHLLFKVKLIQSLCSSQVKFILSQHSKYAKENSEKLFSHLVTCTYIASL